MPRRKIAFVRARQPEQKDQRRDQIMDVARSAFDEKGWDGFTMSLLAQRAGLAKGTAYRYYTTKEALFLDLLIAELESWLAEIGAELDRLEHAAPSRRASRLCQAIALQLGARPRLRKLLSLLHAVLERNVGEEAALAFKLRLAELLAAPAAKTETVLAMQRGEGLRFFLRAHALVVGLSQMAEPSPAIAAVLDSDSRLSAMKIDFAAELQACLLKLIA